MKKKAKKKIPTETGIKIKSARLERGLTQMKLAEKIGISYQQLQKYENGSSDLSLNRLRQFAKVLNLPISYFIDEQSASLVSEPEISYGILSSEELKLIKLLRQINNRKFTAKLNDTLKSLLDIKKK